MIFQGIAGLIFFVAVAWVFSENKRRADIRLIILGIASQFFLAVIILKIPVFKDIFLFLNNIVVVLDNATKAGTSFVFGYLGGAGLPFDEKSPGASYVVAFRAFPLVLVMSALSALLFYWKVLPVVVKGFSFLLQKTFRIGGAEGLGVAANIFMGMVESPLLIRPYIKNMTRSELFSIMTCGMATIAGTMMIIYASILSTIVPDALGHILTASIISAPAAIVIAKIMIPETGPVTLSADISPEDMPTGSMDAIVRGTLDGLKLLLNIIAMIIVLLAIVFIINSMLGIIPDIAGAPVTLERILGIIMAPVMWLMGIPWNECAVSGSLMGIKTVLNEFIAYINLSGIEKGVLSERTIVILTYALCGFANPGSLGIMIGGLGSMAPERRDEIVSLGLRAILAGTIATCMTGAVVGIVLYF
jgi:CNT family concentrative nucleoside transporter